MAKNKKDYKSPELINHSCIGLKNWEGKKLPVSSVHALVTDPPYGINYQNNTWDKAQNGTTEIPDPAIWQDAFRVLKPGGYGLIFSFPRVMHRVMMHLEKAGFEIKDVLFWVYLNGMPKTRNLGLEIDKTLGVESTPTEPYKYKQGYEKDGAITYKLDEVKYRLTPASELGKEYDGAGINLKPAYEPIILVRKPIETGLKIAENIIRHGTGALNLEETRIPYAEGEKKVGHNPHPKGRVPANIIRTEEHEDEYNKFFVIPKVRQKAEDFNIHPTLKPTQLMEHLVRLVSFEGQTVLDPFMGSGSTGVACVHQKRHFIGYEREEDYFKIAEKRIGIALETAASLFE